MLASHVIVSCWRKNWRRFEADFYDLARLLDPVIRQNENSLNNNQLITVKKLVITNYYLKDTRSNGYQCTVLKKLATVCKAINDILDPL